MPLDLDMLVADDGLISREIFSSPEVYARELETVFAKSWLFVGHVSQIPNAGDFFLSTTGEDPVILSRDTKGKVHVFLNSCRHRGMRVCRFDEGNARRFLCPYHGWTYASDGALLGVPEFTNGYEGVLDKSKWGLIEPPHLFDFHGMIWVNWDPQAQPFAESLGDMAFFLEDFLRMPDGGIGEWEVIGGVMKWPIPANWKWGAENFAGDFYHGISHASVDQIAISPSGEVGRHQSDAVKRPMKLINASIAKGGHSARGRLFEDDYPYTSEYGKYPEVDRYFADAYERRQQRLGPLARLHGAGGTVFPNMSYSNGRYSIAVWNPRGADRTEAWRWYLVPKDAPEAVKDVMRHYAIRYQGPSGMTEQDDLENWNYAHEACHGHVARKLDFNYQLGRNIDDSLLAGWNLANTTVAAGFTEHNQRGFYRHWQSLLSGERG